MGWVDAHPAAARPAEQVQPAGLAGGECAAHSVSHGPDLHSQLLRGTAVPAQDGGGAPLRAAQRAAVRTCQCPAPCLPGRLRCILAAPPAAAGSAAPPPAQRRQGGAVGSCPRSQRAFHPASAWQLGIPRQHKAAETKRLGHQRQGRDCCEWHRGRHTSAAVIPVGPTSISYSLRLRGAALGRAGWDASALVCSCCAASASPRDCGRQGGRRVPSLQADGHPAGQAVGIVGKDGSGSVMPRVAHPEACNSRLGQPSGMPSSGTCSDAMETSSTQQPLPGLQVKGEVPWRLSESPSLKGAWLAEGSAWGTGPERPYRPSLPCPDPRSRLCAPSSSRYSPQSARPWPVHTG